jgi:RNA polymerase sigma factor (sigma-70 family)
MLKILFALLTKSNRNTLSDEEAIEEYIKTQNNYYFELLYNRYSAKIFGKCLTLLKDEYEAQDATQDIMMKILLNLSKFSGKSKFSTWVYSITYNFCIDAIRKAKKDKSELVEDISTIADDIEDEISDKFLLEVQLDQLKVILDEIPAGDRSILLMKYMDGMSIKEISDVADKSESAIKMKIKRAKEKFIKVHEHLTKIANNE